MLILIPLYLCLCLLHPLIHDYVPGMLKRMGLGMLLHLISGLCTLVMGVANCNFSSESCALTIYLNISPHFLLFQFSLNAVSYYIASYEFILCAQNPQSMKGNTFAIKGIFQLFNFGVVLYSVIGARCNVEHHFPVCIFIYYLINIVIALIGTIAFVFVVSLKMISLLLLCST